MMTGKAVTKYSAPYPCNQLPSSGYSLKDSLFRSETMFSPDDHTICTHDDTIKDNTFQQAITLPDVVKNN